MNREQLFESVMKEFQNKAIDILEEVASKTVVEYLPHVETDTEWNARHYARALVQDILAGRRDFDTEMVMFGVGAEKVRAAIFEQYRTELEQGLIADLQGQVELLKNILEHERTIRSY